MTSACCPDRSADPGGCCAPPPRTPLVVTLALLWPPPPVGAPSWGPPGYGCPPGRCRASSMTSDMAFGPRPSCSAPSWGLRRESTPVVRLSSFTALTAQPAPFVFGSCATTHQSVAMRGAPTLGTGTRFHIASAQRSSAPHRPRLVLLSLGAQAAAIATRHTSARTAGTYLRKRPLLIPACSAP